MARGFAACLDEAIALVASAPAGFGVTLDLDAIDPLLAPGVGSPEPDGLPPQDVLTALHRISVLVFARWKLSNTTRIVIGMASPLD